MSPTCEKITKWLRGLVLVFYLFFDFFSGEFYGTVSVLCFSDFILFSCTFYAGFRAEFYVLPFDVNRFYPKTPLS